MANQLLTISMITTESARILSNNLVLSKVVNRDFDDEFGIPDAKIGQTVNVRKPARYNLRTGSIVDLQAQTETYAPLVFTNPVGVDLDFTSQEKTFSLDRYSERVIKPAVVRVANGIDALGYNQMYQFYGYQGTPGTALTAATSQAAILNGIAKLYDKDCPIEDGNISQLNGTAFNAVLSNSNASLFNPMKEISEIYVKGMQGTFGGANHYMSQLVPSQVGAVYGGSPVTNSATAQTGSSLITSGWSSGATTLQAGNVFTIAGVYAVNPQTKASLSYLQPFTVLTTISDTAGAITASIAPSIVASGPFQNVSNAAANTQAITVIGATGVASQLAIALHRDALMLANKDLETPKAVEQGYFVREPDTGVGVRVVEAFDVRTNQLITRLDSMVAWAPLYAELGVKVFTS